MFDPHEDWMPIGSVVRLNGGERLVMLAGYLSIDGSTGRAWDYVGYSYPEGKQLPEELFFDRTDVGELYQMGLCDAEGMAFLAHVTAVEERYLDERAQRENRSA